MNLESVIQSEACQKERNNCSILNAYIWNLEKQYWWTYVQGRNRRRLVDTAGEEDSGTNWDSSTETHTLPYAKQTTSGKLLGDTGRSTGLQGALWQPGGVGCAGGRGGIHIYLRLIQVVVWRKPTQYCKAIILQSKTKFKKERYINKSMPPTYPHNTVTNKQITIVSQFLQNIGYFGIFSSK